MAIKDQLGPLRMIMDLLVDILIKPIDLDGILLAFLVLFISVIPVIDG